MPQITKPKKEKHKILTLRLSEKEYMTVKKVTLDKDIGYRDIILLGAKSLGKKSCTKTLSKKQR